MAESVDKTNGFDAFDVFARFGQLLREKGYDTPEKIDQLVKEIKRETMKDWLHRCGCASRQQSSSQNIR